MKLGHVPSQLNPVRQGVLQGSILGSFLFLLFVNDTPFYYIDTSVLLENIPLVKFIKTTSGTRVVYFQ